MMTDTLTLAAFLLARIAEDEADARYHDTVTFGAMQRQVAPRLPLSVDHPGRWLAECEAKRRIVEWHEGRDDCCEDRYGPLRLDADPELSAGTDSFGGLSIRQSIGIQEFLGCVTLMMLALPYADHPDYRDEWKP